jgi:hypothetical protein
MKEVTVQKWSNAQRAAVLEEVGYNVQISPHGLDIYLTILNIASEGESNPLKDVIVEMTKALLHHNDPNLIEAYERACKLLSSGFVYESHDFRCFDNFRKCVEGHGYGCQDVTKALFGLLANLVNIKYIED